MTDTDPSGLYTISVGVGGNVDFGPVNIQFGAGVIADGLGNASVYGYGGPFVVAGAGASGGIQFGYSYACTIYETQGLFATVSAGAGAGLGFGIDGISGFSGGHVIAGGGFTLGFGLGAGASGGATYTKSFPP